MSRGIVGEIINNINLNFEQVSKENSENVDTAANIKLPFWAKSCR